ncbi:MAG: sigma-70 family RNA polymerase sigma factor [Chloroflexota bacterium]|nr:sigma-70 family RNA polymerase sigma factor [Chloroflexota bacterium]
MNHLQQSLADEQGCVERAQKDMDSFRVLYTHYLPRVYAYVGYRVARVQDTEDIVSETFVRAVDGLGRFQWKREGSFAAWLFRIAHNLVEDHRRQLRRLGEPLELADLPELEDSMLLPDDIVLQKEKFAYLRSLVQGLPPRQQEVVTLRLFGGLRNREIAQVLGLNERTVASHLCRAIEDMHRSYVQDSATVARLDGAFDG